MASRRGKAQLTIPITLAEAKAAGDFSAPVSVGGKLWWVLELPVFQPGRSIALVEAIPAD